MKRPLLDMIDRWHLIAFPKLGYSQRLKFYLAQCHFKREIDRILRPIIIPILNKINKML